MRKSLLLVMSLAVGCLIPSALFAKGNPNSCGSSDTSLSLTIEPGAYNISSDTGSAYVSDKKIDVMFQIDNCSYDFTLRLFNSQRYINVFVPAGIPSSPIDGSTTTSGGFNFDRVASVPITNGDDYAAWCAAGVQKNADGSFKTYPSGGKTMPFDNYAPCGQDSEGNRFARRSAHIGLADFYGFAYQDAPLDGRPKIFNDTVFVRVYHPDATTWVLMPDRDIWHWNSYPDPTKSFQPDGAFDVPNYGEKCALDYSPNGSSLSIIGYRIMPFKFTVTKP